VPGVWPALSLVGTVLGITLAARVARGDTAARRALAALGRRTLPVYVIHMPLVALAHLALVGPVSAAGPVVQLVLAVVEPVLLTGVLIALCFWVHAGLNRMGATWLFTLPQKRVSKTVAV